MHVMCQRCLTITKLGGLVAVHAFPRAKVDFPCCFVVSTTASTSPFFSPPTTPHLLANSKAAYLPL